MANEEHLAILRKGHEIWNEWRSLHSSLAPDLRYADLAGWDLRRCGFQFAKMGGANLDDANLSRAGLVCTDLSGATLIRAKARNVDFGETVLTNADLRDTWLQQAHFTRTSLGNANLYGALLSETWFMNTDLSHVRGLDACVHYSPSAIDHRTLLRSGPLPLAFLRGCGLPDRLIDYLPSLLEAGPVQFYSCFISYSTHDQPFAERLHADLQAKGIRCWFAPHQLKAGQKIHEEIDKAIRVYDRLLLVLSNESMASEWVKTEIALARKKEREQQRRVLFPIRLVPFDDVRAWQQFDADLGSSSAKEIREYFLPDFGRWQEQQHYQPVFDKLIEALKREA